MTIWNLTIIITLLILGYFFMNHIYKGFIKNEKRPFDNAPVIVLILLTYLCIVLLGVMVSHGGIAYVKELYEVVSSFFSIKVY